MLLFIRNIGFVTPKIIYFHDVKKYFLDQSIQAIICLNMNTEALLTRLLGAATVSWYLFIQYDSIMLQFVCQILPTASYI